MTSYTIDDGDGGAALDENQQHYRGDGVGVLDPAGGDLAISVNTGALGSTDTLSVAAGDAYVQGTTHTIGSQTIGIDGANGTDPRRDVIYVDTSGAIQVATGTPEARDPDDENLSRFEYFRPAPADFQATVGCVIAEVWVPAGATSVTSSDLRDRRVRALQADSLAEDLTTTTELNNHAGDADIHHTRPSAGTGLTDNSGTFTVSNPVTELASGEATLSSGSVTADTGIATSMTGFYDVKLRPENGADIAASLEDDSGGTGNWIIHLEENTTSVGNPTVGWKLTQE